MQKKRTTWRDMTLFFSEKNMNIFGWFLYAPYIGTYLYLQSYNVDKSKLFNDDFVIFLIVK